jgi:predicted transcriptional regulator of viral defense system
MNDYVCITSSCTRYCAKIIAGKMDMQSYIKHLNNKGIWSFTTADASQNVDRDIPFAIQQMRKAGRLVDPARGFYVIIPEEMSLSDRLPADRYIDDLMAFHQTPYYVGLLTAAFFYGSAHQSPQVFQVITDKSRRPLRVRGGKVRFFTNQKMKSAPVTQRNTPTGYMKISTPETTILDLVKYDRWIGGMDHVANVISEMISQVRVAPLAESSAHYSTPILQRLGYVFDLIGYEKGGRKLMGLLGGRKVSYALLEASGPKILSPKNERWRLNLNTQVELEY